MLMKIWRRCTSVLDHMHDCHIHCLVTWLSGKDYMSGLGWSNAVWWNWGYLTRQAYMLPRRVIRLQVINILVLSRWACLGDFARSHAILHRFRGAETNTSSLPRVVSAGALQYALYLLLILPLTKPPTLSYTTTSRNGVAQTRYSRFIIDNSVPSFRALFVT